MRQMTRAACLALLGALLSATISAQAQPNSSEGREFWLCFQRNHEDNPNDTLQLQLFLTSQYAARVTITIEALGWQQRLQLRAGEIAPVPIPAEAAITTSGVAQRLAVHVVADSPIAVYGLNRRYQSTDTYIGLPVSVLGTEYRVMSYRRLSSNFTPQVAVIATQDSTVVQFLPPKAARELFEDSSTAISIRQLPAVQPGTTLREPLSVVLNRGEVYQLSGPPTGEPEDLTGTLIRASRPIAVFSGHVCAYVPLTIAACNHLVEQLPPVETWGRHFYVGTLRQRSRYVVRVLAHLPQTRIFINDQPVATLEAGAFWEQTFTETVQITSDKPILVAQFSEGFRNGDSIGDPMMLLITPTQQFLTRYRFATPVQGSWRHFINVVIPVEAISTLRVNGAPVRASFSRIANSRYAIAQIEVPYGAHLIEAAQPFGLYAYGFGYGRDSYDAYGNAVGQSFADLRRQQDLLAPEAQLLQRSDGVSVVTIRDDRPSDLGLREVRVLAAENLQGTLPSITPGMLRAEAQFAPQDPSRNGHAVLALTDLAGNRSVYTLCYTYDIREERRIFVLCQGEYGECVRPLRVWLFGAYLRMANVYHAAQLPRIDPLPVLNGTFGNATGWGGLGGVLAGWRPNPSWSTLLRLGIELYGGELAAPDTLLQHVRLPDGQTAPFQEEQRLRLRAPYATLSAGGLWHLLPNLYLLGELQAAMKLGSAITLRRRILQPSGYIYSETGSPERTEPISTLPALRQFWWGLAVGTGVQYRLSSQWNAFGELVYSHGLSSLVPQGRWYLRQLGIRLGILLRYWE